jgi:hypothetical protein
MNKWGIPPEVEEAVLKRDRRCIYCHCEFSKSERKRNASWEHIINDIRITTLENIARCCVGCNASKSAKSLKEWFLSKYCMEKNINQENAAAVVRDHIRKYW